MNKYELARMRVVEDITQTREIVVPQMVALMTEARDVEPECDRDDRVVALVMKLRKDAGELELAIALAVMIENEVDRQKAS